MKEQILDSSEFIKALIEGKKICGEFFRKGEYYYLDHYRLLDEEGHEPSICLAEVLESFYNGTPYFLYEENSTEVEKVRKFVGNSLGRVSITI